MTQDDIKDLIDLKIVDTEELLSLIKKRKPRIDSGKTRAKYDSNLPAKYKSYLMRANKKQFEFELTVDEFNIFTSQPCVYCGSLSKIGIDRVNNNQGYTKDNIQPCCTMCNMMKYTYSKEEFINHIKRIAKFQSGELVLKI